MLVPITWNLIINNNYLGYQCHNNSCSTIFLQSIMQVASFTSLTDKYCMANCLANIATVVLILEILEK